MNVRIFQTVKTAMQSGRAKARDWVLEYETTSRRAPESLMGWTSSADTLNQVRLSFDSVEEAISFAKSKGWDYIVQPAHHRKVTPRNYVDNFKYRPPEEN